MLELDCRHLNSPLPLLLLKRKYGEKLPEKYNEIKMLLQTDITENKRELELANKMCGMGYKFKVIENGITLTIEGARRDMEDKNSLCCENADKELWREKEGDYYSPSIHVTKDGKIGIDVGGLVFVKNIREWHFLANSHVE